jgi:2-keto-3-deoxy-L-rhamnonate aldolase RhmA
VNISAVQRLRKKLALGESVHGMWITLEAPSLTEIGVALGLDWIVIDAEHGHLDWKEIVEHLRAAARSETTMLVRVTEDNPGLIKRALDLGADGIVAPNVQNAAQLRSIVKMAHFPPAGIRGIGAERATCWGQCFPRHIEEAATHTLVVPLIESVTGVGQLSEMLEVEGVEIFWFGPADHSASAGYAGQWEGPGIAEQIVDGIQQITKAGKNAGIIARNEEDLALRQSQGVRVIGLGMDAGLIIASLRRMLAAAGKNPQLQTSLKP